MWRWSRRSITEQVDYTYSQTSFIILPKTLRTCKLIRTIQLVYGIYKREKPCLTSNSISNQLINHLGLSTRGSEDPPVPVEARGLISSWRVVVHKNHIGIRPENRNDAVTSVRTDPHVVSERGPVHVVYVRKSDFFSLPPPHRFPFASVMVFISHTRRPRRRFII